MKKWIISLVAVTAILVGAFLYHGHLQKQDRLRDEAAIEEKRKLKITELVANIDLMRHFNPIHPERLLPSFTHIDPSHSLHWDHALDEIRMWTSTGGTVSFFPGPRMEGEARGVRISYAELGTSDAELQRFENLSVSIPIAAGLREILTFEPKEDGLRACEGETHFANHADLVIMDAKAHNLDFSKLAALDTNGSLVEFSTSEDGINAAVRREHRLCAMALIDFLLSYPEEDEPRLQRGGRITETIPSWELVAWIKFHRGQADDPSAPEMADARLAQVFRAVEVRRLSYQVKKFRQDREVLAVTFPETRRRREAIDEEMKTAGLAYAAIGTTSREMDRLVGEIHP